MKKHLIVLALMLGANLSLIAAGSAIQSIVGAMHHIESSAQQALQTLDTTTQNAVHAVVEQAKEALQKIVENVPHDTVVQNGVLTRNILGYLEEAAHTIETVSVDAIEEIEQNPQGAEHAVQDAYHVLQQAVAFVQAQQNKPQQPIVDTPSATSLVALQSIVPGIKIDNRYASKHNITGQKLFSAQAPCLLSYATARRLAEVSHDLEAQGFGLVVWQAYQSDEEQQAICDLVHNEELVSWCPAVSQGRKLSVSLYCIDTGRAATMPTDFQNVTIKARPDCSDLSLKALHNRDVLMRTMKHYGFEQSTRYWWSFYLPKALAQ